MKFFLCALLLLPLTIGCSTVAKTTEKLAAKTVSTAGSVAAKATPAAVSTTGQAAIATTKPIVHTTGQVVAATARTGMVTFKDLSTGVTRQIPWVEGMKLYAASKTAQFDAGLQALQILRSSHVIKADLASIKSGKGDLSLQPGDVVEISRNATAKSNKRT